MKRGKSRNKTSAVLAVILILTLIISMTSLVSAQWWLQQSKDYSISWTSLTPNDIVCKSPLGSSQPSCCGSYPELCVKNPSVSPYETNPEAKRAYEELLACYQKNGYSPENCNLWPFQRSKELSPGAGQLEEDKNFCYDRCVTKPKESDSYDYSTEWEDCRVPCLKGRGYTEHYWAFEEINKAINDAMLDYLNTPKTETGPSEHDTTDLTPVAGCEDPAYVRDENGNCYLETNEVNEKATIPQQCIDTGLPPECCQPPLYLENPACPFRDAEVSFVDSDVNSLSTKFSSLGNQATPVVPQTVEFDGKAVPLERLGEGIGDSRVQIKSPLGSIKEGQPFSQTMPKDSLLQKAILVPSKPISDGEMIFTLNEKPKSLNIPEPDPRYEVKSVIGLEFTSQKQETKPLSEALFYIKQPGGKLLRYDTAKRDWTPLEVQNTEKGFIARSSGNSYFAIVVEKPESKGAESVIEKSATGKTSSWAWILIALIATAAVVYYFLKMRKK